MKLLLAYCIIACIALAVLLVGTINNLSQLKSVLPALQVELELAQGHADAARTRLKELERVQRLERGDYSGPEAVDASYEIQEAQQVSQAADAKAAKQEDGLRHLLTAIEEQERKLIPLIALLLLHVFGGIMFADALWKRRSRPPAS